MSADLTEMVAFRLPKQMLKRIDALIKPLGRDPALEWGPMNRSSVLRIALGKGLKALEKEYL